MQRPPRSVIVCGAATALSLLGDQALYALLPIYFEQIGLAPIHVGILLSANRWVRLLTNTLAERVLRALAPTHLFAAALLLGGLTTLAYALSGTFLLLLLARLAWGLSWSFIRHASVMSLATTHTSVRGQMMGIYSGLSRIGGIGGIVLGGFLFDAIGFEATFLAFAALSLLAVPLPLFANFEAQQVWQSMPPSGSRALLVGGFCVSAVGPGLIMSTLGFILLDRFGDSFTIAGMVLGVASLTGLLLGSRWIFDTLCGPLFGAFADRYGMLCATSVCFGSGLLALTALMASSHVVVLTAAILWFFASGTALQVALAGEASRHGSGYYARFATAGDLGAATGPLIGWSVLQLALPTTAVFGSGAALYAAGFIAALLAFRRQPETQTAVR